MRGRLITNGVLSIFASITLIIYISMIMKTTIDVIFNENVDNIHEHINDIQMNYAVIISGAFYSIFHLASLIMGIITLSLEKHKNAKGLTMASGILAILGGCFFAGTIVSFIGVAKAK